MKKKMTKKIKTVAKKKHTNLSVGKKKMHEFMKERMEDFKEGKMHSRKKRTGPLVTSKDQALAIALSEARKKGMPVKRKRGK